MSTASRLLCLILCVPSLAAAQSTGSGAAPPIQARFQAAFLRGSFSTLVSQPPVADVHSFGTTGLIQEFNTLSKTQKAALVLADQTKIGFEGDVVQVLPDLYAYYVAVGVNTAGYPIEDTQFCTGSQACTYQRFTNSYALFAFPLGNSNGTQIAVAGAFYTKWIALNYVNGPLGIVSSPQSAVTSPLRTTAIAQDFAGGSIYNITSGTNKALTFSVLGATNTLYQSLGGPAGLLGLPLGDELSLAGNIQRQLFEGGRIQYATGGIPALVLPVVQVGVTPAGPFTLQGGQSVTLTESGIDTAGAVAAGRAVSWSTTNSQVVSVAPNGATAVITAHGSGNAFVTATSEGKVGTPVLFTVNAPCCGVGEGAPSVAIGQTFQDAVNRNRLSVLVPGPNPVKRTGTGFTQDLISSDGSTHYLIAKSDQSGTAYLVAGALLSAFQQAGGSAGSLGFPVSDVSAGGTQLFQGGALAGSPLRTVSGAVFAKWAGLNYEAGVAGTPIAGAVNFSTQSGFGGQSQQFSKGSIFGIATGSRAGQGYFVSGQILARYLSLQGPAGSLGLPVTDSFANGSVQRQNFENGYIDYVAGAASAQEHLVPRSPAITANPASALAGSRLHLSVSGFAIGATLRISVTGQPDFIVKTQDGSYNWDVNIDAAAKSATFAVHAVDPATGATADGSYSVKTVADAKPSLTKVSGDNQTGSPGSLLPVNLTVAVKDGAGAPLAGVAVNFSGSPGSQVSAARAMTDLNGLASTQLRLPLISGLAALTVSALGQVAIFDARALGSSPVSSFPQFTQASGTGTLGKGTDAVADKGGLLTTLAAIIRFYQNQGLLGTPNGLADPNALNAFLKTYCAPGTRTCDGYLSVNGSPEQVVNPWRAAAFAGGGLVPSVESADLAALRDLVSTGSPILLSLALQEDGQPAGGAAVVATGIAADGSLQLFDPNPVLARASFADYLSGFSAAGHAWKASLLSALRLLPGEPASTGFVFTSVSQPFSALPVLNAQSAARSCGQPFLVQDSASVAVGPVFALRGSEFLYCDGTQPLYIGTVTGTGGSSVSVTDLGPGGTAIALESPSPAGYRITRAPAFTVDAPSVSLTSAGVVNAASFGAAVAPGGIISIFGSGLAAPSGQTQVGIAGVAAPVLGASAFQVNAQIPLSITPGTYSLSVTSTYGTASVPVSILPAAPGIFVLGPGSIGGASQGAVVNQSGTVNSAANPARRGETIVIYGTGLGMVAQNGILAATLAPVTVVVAGTELAASFSGLTPGFVGLYQVNVPVPVATPPGLSLSLFLRESGMESNTVAFALQ